MGFWGFFADAIRTATRGRASGGLAVFVNKDIFSIKFILNSDKIMIFEMNNLKIIIIFVFVNQKMNVQNVLSEIEPFLDDLLANFSDFGIIFGSYFNSRIGEDGQIEKNF